MKIFSRFFCILLCFSLIFCTIGCKKNDNNIDNNSSEGTSAESVVSDVESEDNIVSSNSGNASSSQSAPVVSLPSTPEDSSSSTPTTSTPSQSVSSSVSSDDHIWENGIDPTDQTTYYTPMSMLTITIGMSKAALKRLITEMSYSGVDALFLGIGGDFIMDDMTITTEYGTYTLNYFLEGRRYNQKDMDEILAHAKAEGVEIIPTLQTPGHMSPFLSKRPDFAYPGTTSLDLTNPEATAYMHAAYKKYGEYFASKGCKYFSVSADEWGHEFEKKGYDYLYNNGEMKYFVDYMNTNIENLSNLGFEVMAWNDGICYNEDVETYGKIDNRLIVLYWTPGWFGNKFATPKFLEEQGYRIVNSYHTYYIESNSNLDERAGKLSQFNFWIGNYKLKNPVGGMCCIWARPRDNDHGMTTVLSLIGVLNALSDGVEYWKIPTSGNGYY